VETYFQAAESAYDAHFADQWDSVFKALATSHSTDTMWLAGSSSYVFSIDGIKFAVDLQIRRKKDLEILSPRLQNDLAPLSFVLITHPHDDHLNPAFIRTVKDLPIRWFLPAGIGDKLIEASEIPKDRLILLKSGDVIEEGNLKIRAFYSPHVEADSKVAFPQLGYEITSPKGTVLLPGDVRDYSYRSYPHFGKIDLCISHLWGGQDPKDPNTYLPMLKEFAVFSAAFQAKRYFFTHLYELGRKDRRAIWTYAHGGIAMDMLLELLPQSDAEIPRIGRAYSVFDENKETRTRK
jgi:hypothetical protein